MRGIDTYTFSARFVPFALVVSPVLAFALATSLISPTVAIGGALGTCLVCVGAQLARDPGKALQDHLWKSWGGAPTTQRLRYRGTAPARVVDRLHDDVEQSVRMSLPTAREEEADPVNADQIYEQAVDLLRGFTRDRTTFDLLFKENVHYGFRRNLLGLRRVGIAIAVAVIVASFAVYVLSGADGDERLLAAGLPTLWSLAVLILYVGVVRPEWVRVPAEEYADQLMAAAQVLAHQSKGT